MDSNPCTLVPRKKVVNDRRFVLSRQQLKRLLTILSLEPLVHDVCLFAFLTGLRFSKIAHLTSDEIHRDETGTWFAEFVDKNGDLFRCYLVGQAQEIVKKRIDNTPFLFVGPKGGQIRYKYLVSHLKPACAMAGIDYHRGRYGFTFHSLRRAFASHALNAGLSLETVQEIGNWRDFRSVQRYAKLSSRSKKAGFRAVSRLLE